MENRPHSREKRVVNQHTTVNVKPVKTKSILGVLARLFGGKK